MTAPEPDASDDDEPAIPDLDVMQVQSTAAQVADAPAANVQVSTMAELDQDLSAQGLVNQMDDGIDLRLLTTSLSEKLQDEPDEAWTFDVLFTEVKSELQAEHDAKNKASSADAEQDTAAAAIELPA